MTNENGASAVHHKIDERFDSIKARIHDAVDHAEHAAKSTSGWLRAATTKTGEAIKAHPIAAAAIALGLGYAIMRMVRR